MNSNGRVQNAGNPLITISVVSHGDAGPLGMFLRGLATYESPAELQIIITDNLGSDVSDFASAPWHSLTLLRNERPVGYARNHNLALAQAKGEFFCVVNPDVCLIEPVLQSLMRTIREHAADIVAPLVVDSGGVIQDSFRGLPSPLEIVERRLRRTLPAPSLTPGAELIRTDWLAGIFMLFHRDTFSRLNGFDTRYRLYFEDVDFCTRARLAGLWSGVDARLRIQHDARRASRRPGQHLFWHLQSSLRFFTSRVYWKARKAGL